MSQLRETIAALFYSGQLVELRVLGQKVTYNLYFNEPNLLLEAAEEFSLDPTIRGVYVTLHQLDRDKILTKPRGVILNSLANMVKPVTQATTNDDVKSLNWFLIDCDPERTNGESKSNSTRAEKKAAADRANVVHDYLTEQGWPEPILADSGNGWHMLYKIDIPLWREHEGTLVGTGNALILRSCLMALSAMFTAPEAKVDTSVWKPAQVTKLYGTMTRKGQNEDSRPWRKSKLVDVPKAIEIVPLEKLQALAALAPPEAKRRHGEMPTLEADFDIEEFCEHYGLVVSGTNEKADGRKYYILDVCPIAGHKHSGDANKTALVVGTTLGFECWSDECNDTTIGDVLRKLNETHERYDGPLFVEVPLDWNAMGVEEVDDHPEEPVEKIEAKITFTPKQVEEQKLCVAFATPEEAKAAGVEFNNKGRLCLKCGLTLVLSAMETMCRDCRRSAENEASGVEPIAEGKNTGRQLTVRRGFKVQTAPIEWMWPGRIPSGKITIFSGKADCAKSLTLIDIASRVTNGWDWPDGSKNTMGPRRVLFAVSEDDLEDTVVPRLQAAGANMELVDFIENSTDAEGKKTRFNLKNDILLVELAFKTHPDYALFILDPITSFYGSMDTNADKDMRPIYEQLQQMCGRTKTAVVGIAHNNKKINLDAVQRIGGAGAITQVTRSVWAFSKDPDNADEYFMSKAKGNLTARGTGGLKYKVVTVPVMLDVGGEVEVPKVEWIGKHNLSADDVNNKQAGDGTGEDLTTVGKATLLLRDLLEKNGGSVKVSAVHELCKQESITYDGAMKRASYKLNVIRSKPPGPFFWTLPSSGVVESKPELIVDEAEM